MLPKMRKGAIRNNILMMKQIEVLNLILEKKKPLPKGCNKYSSNSVILMYLLQNGQDFKGGFSYVSNLDELIIVKNEELDEVS